MFLSSLSFADTPGQSVITTEENKWYTTALKGSGSASNIEYTVIKNKGSTLPPGSIVFWEVGRLSSLMYLSQSGAAFPPMTLSGSHDLMFTDTQWIVSLYDLFSTYTIHSQNGEYRLDQITNGSFYIGKEKDGKIVIYAIDGVIRLAFLDKGIEMTSMILFPGSYIRFDPKRNASLKWADLFRTILSLQEWENEIFEFVNPRVNTGDDTDTFFNYRLPLETKWLFRTLSARFHAQVESVDLMKSYGTDVNSNISTASNWLMNPAKKNHLMLMELKYLLSQVVRSKSSATNIVPRIGEIYENAKALKMESSTAKKAIEKFLLDGRFALYGNTSDIGGGYQDTYEKIAKLIGIEKSAGKSKLLQNLADIYSGNLFLQMSKTSTFKIDTFEPTATTLRSTIDESGIDQKDFFDIAIYTYNILDKIQDKWLLSREYLQNKSTYDYLTTFFYAWSKYMSSIDDGSKRAKTILSFSSQFYEKVLTLIVRSLYATLMRDDNGALYLADSFVNGSMIKLDIDLMKQIKRLNGVISYVNDSIKSAYQSAGDDTDVYTKIQKSTRRLDALANLLDPESYNAKYKTYVDMPFATTIEDGIALPEISDDLSGVTFFVKKPDIIDNPISTLKNKKVDIARALFPDADISSFIPEWDFLTVKNAPGYLKKMDGSLALGTWNMTFLDENSVSQIFLFYNGRSIEVKFATPNTDLESFKLLQTTTLKPYLDILDSNSDIAGNVRIFINLKRIDIDEKTFIIQE